MKDAESFTNSKLIEIKWCKWCRKKIFLNEEPDHFLIDGWCAENWANQSHYGDAVNKRNKENAHNLSESTYNPDKDRWGG